MAKQKKVVSRKVVFILLLLFIAPVIGVVADGVWERHLKNKYGPALPFLQQDLEDAQMQDDNMFVIP